MANIDSIKAELDAFQGIVWSSCGGLEDDGPAWIKFEVEKSELGWRTVEFLAWIMEDMRLAGERLHFFPTAPAPYLNEPGQCLSFVLEIYPKDADEAERLPKVAAFIRWCRSKSWDECAP